jgi:hypothetical protein
VSSSPDRKQAPVQLLAYTFPPESDFGGRLIGALQRIESGGAIRIVDALFVGREAESGELVAVSLQSRSSAGMIGQLIGFRLDASARGSQTESALAGPNGELVRALAAELEPGHAVAALLVEHTWARLLEDAAQAVGGAPLVSEILDAGDADAAWASLPGRLGR